MSTSGILIVCITSVVIILIIGTFYTVNKMYNDWRLDIINNIRYSVNCLHDKCKKPTVNIDEELVDIIETIYKNIKSL